MANPHEQPPDRALALCATEREIPAVDDERRARMLARIERATGARASKKVAAAAVVAAPSLGDATVGTVGKTGLAIALKSKIAIAVFAFSAGAGTGASIHAIVATPAPPAPPSASAIAATAPASASAPRAPRGPLPVPSTPAPASAEPSSPPAPSPVTASPPPASASVAAGAKRERALIDQARIAVLRGDKASALSALQAHAVEFPDGQHRAERETLRRRAEALP